MNSRKLHKEENKAVKIKEKRKQVNKKLIVPAKNNGE